jgi:hypothetical protein
MSPTHFLIALLLLALVWGGQGDRPLTLAQIEKLLEIKIEDENLALQIRRQGIEFRLTEETRDRLRKLGAGKKTEEALQEKEEGAAYAEFSNETNAARRLRLGQAYLQKYPRATERAKVAAEVRKAELDVFELEYRAFSEKPNAASLEKVLAMGRDLLERPPDIPGEAHVASRLAMATGIGMIGNFYTDLDQSRQYADRALRLLEAGNSPEVAQLRAVHLPLIYRSLGLYQIRQPVPDPDQAIILLTRSVDLGVNVKDSAVVNDPIPYWLRAIARDLKLQKLTEDYRAFSKEQRIGRQGQALCNAVTSLINQLIVDYTQVVSLSSRAEATSSDPQVSQLKTQAIEAINQLATGERPCPGGRAGLIDELPAEEKRTALVIGVEEYLDKQAGKFNYAASDARAVAAGLMQYGGFQKERVVLLASGEPAERQPLRSVILQQLADLPNRLAPDGLLLVYFAGHSVERSGAWHLLASDSLMGNDTLLADTAIPVQRLKEMILASGAGQIMLVFDSFRSAPLGENLARQLSFEPRKNEVAAFATLLSAGVGQRGRESAARKQGVFTAVLLDAMKGKAAAKARGVTLQDLVNYLQTNVPREAGAPSDLMPLAATEGYDPEDLVVFEPRGEALAGARKAPPAELIRNSKTIQVRSGTVYMNEAVFQAELRKLPEFQSLNLNFVSPGQPADLLIEIKLPLFTWMWNYTVTHRPSNTPLLSGKMRGLTDTSVSPGMARDLLTRLLALRDSPQK